MSALRHRKPSEVRSTTNTSRKPAGRENVLHWERYKTDYQADTGYSPAYHEAVRLKPGLCGESAVMRDLIEYANIRSYGRQRDKNKDRHKWTDLLTTDELAQHCRCNVREIQRQLSEMEERGMIAVRRVKGGIEVSLLYSNWPNVEDYAVWKQKQKVTAIDESEKYTEAPADEEPDPVQKDAVHLFKRPPGVRPGRATRAVPVAVGIREFVFVNQSKTVDASCTAVIQSGRLIVSACFNTIESQGRSKGEQVARNDAGFLVTPSVSTKRTQKNASGDSCSSLVTHPSSGELSDLFNPYLLQNNPPQSLAGDPSTLRNACAAMGAMPIDFLVRAYTTAQKGRKPRCKRTTRLTDIVPIIQEARTNWEMSGKVLGDTAERDGLLKKLGLPVWASITDMQGEAGVSNLRASLRRSVNDPDMTAEHQAAVRRLLEVI